MIRPTVARIDLDALKANYHHIVEHLARDNAGRGTADVSTIPTPGVIAVVKANAYGHGAAQVALALEDAGADLLACADIEEGVALRAAGVRAEILVFGALSVSELDGLFDCRLTPTISTPGAARSVQAASAKYQHRLRYHLKIDTGMNRLGFRFDNLRRTLPELLASPNLELAAVYTHFGTADEPESTLFAEQRVRFERALKDIEAIRGGDPALRQAQGTPSPSRGESVALRIGEIGDLAADGPQGVALRTKRTEDMNRRARGARRDQDSSAISAPSAVKRGTPYVHAANSAALLRDSRVWYDRVRPGLLLYGIVPPPLAATLPLTPIMTLRSRIVAVKGVRAGEGVGYGVKFTAEQPTTIAIVPAGYADGLDLRLAGRGSVLVRGRRAPIVGSVCMDMLMADVTGLDVSPGDEVVIIGSQGGDRIDVRQMAAQIGTIPYEILCRIGARIERVYD